MSFVTWVGTGEFAARSARFDPFDAPRVLRESGCRVLYHAPPAALQAPGGGERQLLETARQLRIIGIDVNLFDPWRDQLGRGRILHLFGMSREGLELARMARARGAGIALSPICWFEPRALWSLAPNRARGALDVAKWCLRRSLPGIPSWRSELAGIADVILPNSHAEGRQMASLFGVDRERIVVAPNGAAPSEGDPERIRSHTSLEDFVLYAGRIEPRKNVLGLVRACVRVELPLLVIGSEVPGHEAYAARCRDASRGARVVWVPRVAPDSELLRSAMSAARVVALVSWFETPGLAALEGAMAGAGLVITPYGSAREYFGDLARYARPGRIDEISWALREAWERGAHPALAEHVRRNFTWDKVAVATAEAYERIRT